MDIRPFDWRNKQPLAEHYMHDFGRVADLFSYSPHDPKSWRDRALELDRRDGKLRADRRGLIDALLRFNRQAGNTAETLASIESLNDDGTLVVIGGQQAGLFTGPLLVISKAITVLKAAEEASRRLGRKVLPVFWIAGEDHDWEEVNHYYTMSGDDQPTKHRLRVADAAAGGAPVSHVRVRPEEWREALRELNESLPDAEFKPLLMERLQAIHAEAESLSDAFARILAWLFGKHGLIVVDAADPHIRALEAGMFLQMLDLGPLLTEAIVQGRKNVEAGGYKAQAEADGDSVHLFVLEEGRRLLLYRTADGNLRDRHGRRTFTPEELRDQARRHPERLSNGALTRPLMQEYLFPVLATVLGPAEIAYWGMLRPAFELFGMRMPVVLPRTEYTLLEPGVRKLMEKYGLSFEDVIARFEEKRRAWLKSQDQLNLDDRFAQAKEAFLAYYEPVLAVVASIHDGMARLSETNRRRILDEIDYLHRRAAEAYESRFEAGLRQLRKIEQSLYPLGKPQERVYNVFGYLNRYGTDWLDAWVRSAADADGRHYLIFI
jgi:bacillithiol biosynthesis cysteine-adding enzyme BshC